MWFEWNRIPRLAEQNKKMAAPCEVQLQSKVHHFRDECRRFKVRRAGGVYFSVDVGSTLEVPISPS